MYYMADYKENNSSYDCQMTTIIETNCMLLSWKKLDKENIPPGMSHPGLKIYQFKLDFVMFS